MEMTQHTTPLGLQEEGFPLSVLESTLRSNISYKCCVMGPGKDSDVDRRERGSTKVVWTHASSFAQGPLIKAIPNHAPIFLTHSALFFSLALGESAKEVANMVFSLLFYFIGLPVFLH